MNNEVLKFVSRNDRNNIKSVQDVLLFFNQIDGDAIGRTVPVVFTLFLSIALNALLILLARPSSIDLSIKRTGTKSILCCPELLTSEHILGVLLDYHACC
jgi:hypothetical protein